MNKIYGFEGEVRSKLSETFVKLFAEVFCCLPLAHVINEKVFVVHGGLFSVDGVKLSDIKTIDQFCEPPEEGLMCELLLSDPQPYPGRGHSKWGVGPSFGADVTNRNNLDLVVWSHEVKEEGYEIEHDGKLITVFSAPNYCDQAHPDVANGICQQLPSNVFLIHIMCLVFFWRIPIILLQPNWVFGFMLA